MPPVESPAIVQLRMQLAEFIELGRVDHPMKPTKTFDKLLSKSQRERMKKRVTELVAKHKAFYKRNSVRMNGNRKSQHYETRKKDAEYAYKIWSEKRSGDADHHLLYMDAYFAAAKAAIYFFKEVPVGERGVYKLHPAFDGRLREWPRTAEEFLEILPAYNKAAAQTDLKECDNPSKIAAIEALEALIAEKVAAEAAREAV